MRAKSTLGVLLGGLILLLVGFLTRNIPTKADTPRRGATQSKVPKARKAPKALRSPAESPESPTKPPLALATASFRDLPQAIRRAARERQAIRKKPAIPAPPVSLTATDGTGLRLLSLGARAAIEGPLALTELRLAFENPRPRTIEGRFEITLPTGAAISRFAMRLPSGWQEAEVVERQAAHQAYESYLHLNQDPALLEKKAGNTFRARVFPIPPRGVKELIISYSQRLSGKQPTYKLRLRGLPKLRRLSVTVTWGQREQKPARSSLGGISLASRVTRVTKSDYRPVTDFTLPIPALGDGLRHGNLVVARVTPPLPTTLAAASFTGLAVLIDTSASRAAGLGAQVETLRALIATLAKGHGEHLPLEIAAFDQGIEPIYRGTLGGFDRAAAARILLRRGLGASNLHGALTWAQNLRGVDRLLVITDGLATAGPTQTRALRAAAKELPQAIQRLDVLLVGGSHDRQAMRRLVTGTRHDDGAVIDAETPTVQIARRLDQITLSGVEIRIPGARWVWPSVLDGLQPGQTALVYADVPKLPSAHPLDIHLSGRVTQHVQLQLKTAPRPLVARACAQARIERLEARRDALTSETKGSVDAQLRALTRRIVALSTRYRVLSDATAMIVLENDAAYRRFHISRRALAGILTVDPYGVQILNRKTIVTAPPQQRFNGRNAGLLRFLRASPVNAYGLGGLGLTGTGRGGGATATGSQGTLGLGTLGTIGKGGGGGTGAGYGRGASTGVLRAPSRVAGIEGPAGHRSSGRHRTHLFGASGRSRPQGTPMVRSLAARRLAARRRTGQPPRRSRRVARIPQVHAHRVQVHAHRVTVRGALDREIIRRIIRRHINEVKYCYQRELQTRPRLHGRVVVRFMITGMGHVGTAQIRSSTVGNRSLERCVAHAVRRWRFPKPSGGGIVIVSYPFEFNSRRGTPPQHLRQPRPPRRAEAPPPRPSAHGKTLRLWDAATQKYRAITALLSHHKNRQALIAALRWQTQEPVNVLALISLGETLNVMGYRSLAARAYGSLIDLYPSHAAMRRHAAERLETLGKNAAPLAIDAYEKALALRPDHVTGYRLLAWAQFRGGQPHAAFTTLESAFAQTFPSWRARAEWRRPFREDLGLIAASWLRQEPKRRTQILRRLKVIGASLATTTSLRFILSWETDSNDVDLHVRDARGGHAFYIQRHLASGGDLYHDVVNGYGPEFFTIRGHPQAFPYRLSVHYYSRGAMGYGLGTVQIVQHDGRGHLRFDDRPFVVLDRNHEAALGKVKGPL